jgi:cbb3-type cytochrome oxidase subunit 3
MKRNQFHQFLFFLFFLGTVLFAFLLFTEKNKIADLKKYNMELKGEIDRLNLAFQDNNSDLKSPQKSSKLQSWDITGFQKNGLKNPEEEILNDLMKQSRLIRFEPKPGVSWRFDRNETIILSNRWIFTKFDEGHMLGSMLLQYSVKNGFITWEAVSQVLD